MYDVLRYMSQAGASFLHNASWYKGGWSAYIEIFRLWNCGCGLPDVFSKQQHLLVGDLLGT